MPAFGVGIDTRHLTARFDVIGPNVREALHATVEKEVPIVTADAQSRAAAHIRLMGADPGSYLAGIYGGVAAKEARVVGYVRSNRPTIHYAGRDVPLAVVMEYGAKIPVHEILPSVREVLHFMGSAGEVFAKHVAAHGGTIPPYPAINPAFQAAAPRIREELEQAVRMAAKKGGE